MHNENFTYVHLLGYKHVTVLFSKYGKWFIILIPLHFCIYLNMFVPDSRTPSVKIFMRTHLIAQQ